jgi:beta-galactosidase/beta-glucuronidase
MKQEYPRPQFCRGAESWKNLNGEWDFAFDDLREGLRLAWPSRFPAESRKIWVPFTYETVKSGIGDAAPHDTVWYRRKFSLENFDSEKRFMLHFEGCDYRTKVWINGEYTGIHEGGYARFSFDISGFVKPGSNELTVQVEDSFDMSQPRGKQRWKKANFGCWYEQTTGIWKTVWLEILPPRYIESVKMTPLLSEQSLDAEIFLCPDFGDENSSVRDSIDVEISISFQNTFVAGVTLPAVKPHLKTRLDVFSAGVYEWGLMTWSPEHPNLYDIRFRLLQNGALLDEVFSYFGMREIRIHGKNILLNGSPLYQRLILDQGYWKDSGLTPPDEQALLTDIESVIAAGYNGVRKHQKIEDERFLYWCDRKGLLVWSEMAGAYRYHDSGIAGFTLEWMEIIRQQYNHPSIITWTPFNESWGVPNIKTNPREQHFTEAIYHLTKAFDPYRPVICNDGWEHTISDIITLHDYEELGEEFLKRYARLEEILENRIYHSLSKSAFAEGYTYRGQPIIISEFGGIAFNNGDSGWGYGNKVNSKEKFIARFESITLAIKQLDAVCGYCYTQLTDVQQEINGIMDVNRTFKVEPAILKGINERKVSVLH